MGKNSIALTYIFRAFGIQSFHELCHSFEPILSQANEKQFLFNICSFVCDSLGCDIRNTYFVASLNEN